MRKTIVIVLVVLIIGLLILGMTKKPNGKSEPFISKVEQSTRIKLIETTVLEHHRYSIIEADNHQYISTDSGIVHSESCPCKNKQN